MGNLFGQVGRTVEANIVQGSLAGGGGESIGRTREVSREPRYFPEGKSPRGNPSLEVGL